MVVIVGELPDFNDRNPAANDGDVLAGLGASKRTASRHPRPWRDVWQRGAVLCAGWIGQDRGALSNRPTDAAGEPFWRRATGVIAVELPGFNPATTASND